MLDRYDQDLLLDYLEDELDANRRAQLDAILAKDPQLATLLDEMLKDRDALRSLPRADAPADLVHDVTQTLERRMLLDDTPQETGPIQLARGGAFDSEPARSISWGRVVGLTGLAASVALAAGIVVITLDDPLERTADHLAASDRGFAEEAEMASADPESQAWAEDATAGMTALEKPAATDGLLAREASAALPIDRTSKGQEAAVDKAFALGHVAPGTDTATPPAPPATLAPEQPREGPLSNSTLGSTAAISVIQPRHQLVLLTESPDLTEEHLFQFCVDNGIPIVQPDQQAQLVQGRDRQPNSAESFRREAAGDAGAAEPVADYALLINETQLDTLVESLNYHVTLEPKRAGKASLFSNQAALLTDLPEKQAAAPDTTSVDPAAQENDATSAEQSNEQADKLILQQAVRLRLPPDLGSDYNNNRNAYNLKAQEHQAGYAQWNGRGDLAEASNSPAEAPAVTAAPEPAPLADLNKPDDKAFVQVQPELGAASDSEADTAARPDEPAMDEVDETSQTDLDRFAQIDPTRGNWLAAHLPMTDTTPLLLHWRTRPSSSPTSLVPVRIELAEPDRVNTLRQRQQIELASRRNRVGAEAKEQPATDLSTESAGAPVESKPADDTPEPSELSE